ncbi:MAG: amidophosphoribosyltransferase, partial [Flavobacteriaceae bacterium]
STLYGINMMYLLMEKQHNRGQDGAGFASIKYDMDPGQRYISRVRSSDQQPIQHIFKTINKRVQKQINLNPDILNDADLMKQEVPYLGELMLGHVRYGTFGKNNIESVHPFLRQNNWMHRNLIVAGNFNLTNVDELFDNLVELGQHPKERADTITVMEKIGHFLDDAVAKIYKKLKYEGYSKAEASPLIAERLKMAKVLRRAAKNWDGGYAIAGLLGHGDAFVLRDPVGIRPVYYYTDDEIVVVASERPVIQTVFNVPYQKVLELERGHAILTKKTGEFKIKQILEPQTKKACSFERIYFSRGGDAEIYQERKDLGRALFPQVFKAINGDLKNSVFSFIPNTAETSFYGMIAAVQEHLREELQKALSKDGKPDFEMVSNLLSLQPRVEKIAIKDAKLRTFIAEDSGRDDLVAHVYDVTYGVVKKTDNLVIIDDSIVRGTTLQKSILRMLDRLGPRKIVVLSSAPQIRYPDCYGIDMAKLEEFIAFRAALELHKDAGTYNQVLNQVYENCKESIILKEKSPPNHVKAIYDPFTDEDISEKIGHVLKNQHINAEIEVIFQKVSGLHLACPKNLGDWYFTGNYPTPGGCRVVNQSFVNFIEKKNKRAY